MYPSIVAGWWVTSNRLVWFLPSSRVKGGEREEVKMEWGGNGIGVKELVEIN